MSYFNLGINTVRIFYHYLASSVLADSQERATHVNSAIDTFNQTSPIAKKLRVHNPGLERLVKRLKSK